MNWRPVRRLNFQDKEKSSVGSGPHNEDRRGCHEVSTSITRKRRKLL